MSQVTRGMMDPDELIEFLAKNKLVPKQLLIDHMFANITGSIQQIRRFDVDAQLNTDIFSLRNRLRPKLRSSLFRFQIKAVFGVGTPRLRIRSYIDGQQFDSHVLSNDVLVTLVPRSFDFQVSNKYEYGLFLDVDATIEELIIDEIPISS